ncbi:MAG: nucleotidyltransferase domain-containing protein [Proteobacteria bacterium]|nr:nucleotidyltransferase domain-containing protein [Pseudomonadota bacterium]
MKSSPIETTKQLCKDKYADAMYVLLAGSIIRGEATKTSDLDIVVIYKDIVQAYRASYYYGGYPVEVFVHSLATLEYFFELDKQAGIPSLINMVEEGIEVSNGSNLSSKVKDLAHQFLKKGPPDWGITEIDNARYTITDMIDDIRDPRSVEELYATASVLYSSLANYYFRSQNLWSARGKSIPRRMAKIDASFTEIFTSSFNTLFNSVDPQKVIELSQNILAKDGGFLFNGHKLYAPIKWKVTK